MWYDATSAAGSLEADGLPGQGQDRLRRRRRWSRPKSSGWLYAWAWGIQQASTKKDNAWKFISWASSKEYEELVGAAARLVQGPGRQARLDLREPRLPRGGLGVRRRRPRRPSRPPTRTTRACSRGRRIGIQFVDIPEFPDLGTQVSQDVSSAIAGQTTVERGAGQGPGARRGRRRAVPVQGRQ